MQEIERRILAGGLELRAGPSPRLVGYAAKFNVWSEDLGGFKERIEQGAFDKVLAAPHDVRALVNHDGVPFARTSSGTLRLRSDQVGLRVEADVPRSWQQLVEALQRGDIDQMSFAFRVKPGGARWNLDTDPVERTISEVEELLEVSVVSFPAYPQTEAALRSLQAARGREPRGARLSVLELLLELDEA